MKKAVILTILCLIFTFSAEQAQAGSFRFGTNQKVKHIEDISLPGPKGEQLYIGHLVETRFFLLGIYVKDGGYVLGVKGNSDSYLPMLEEEKLKLVQEAGLLPKELPGYSLETIDYLIGYSLWIVIAVMLAWTGIKQVFKKKSQPSA